MEMSDLQAHSLPNEEEGHAMVERDAVDADATMAGHQRAAARPLHVDVQKLGRRPLRRESPIQVPAVRLASLQPEPGGEREDRRVFGEELEELAGARVVGGPQRGERGERALAEILVRPPTVLDHAVSPPLTEMLGPGAGVSSGRSVRPASLVAGTIHLLFGRHGARDHYLGGRYRPLGRGGRPGRLAFALGGSTVHLFERITPSQLREPVPGGAIFPDTATRYRLSAVAFALRVEAAGGRSYNAESRPSAALDREYARLRDAALTADRTFFQRPTYAAYLALAAAEGRFGALRQDLIEANLEHFAAQGHDVVARLGRVHSRARRLARRGLVVRARIGAGSFFPEQALKRRALFGLAVREEDRRRGYVDRLLRTVPAWEAGPDLPTHRRLFSLAGEHLAAVVRHFDAAAGAARSLPTLRELRRILDEAARLPRSGR
jgi:hypothetical protein